MDWLINLMSQSLEGINSFVGNYGVSIIIFTVIVKLLLYPLSAKQARSMKDMQKLQPELKKIQEKYKDDKQKQTEAMTGLYKEHGVNPAAGCFPMILTLIIIWPLYRAIYGLNVDQTTFLWIQNLAKPDIALVILNALAMVGQTYITTKLSGNNSQSNMIMYMMPLFLLFIGFQLPAGILIYWFTQTVLTGLQQYIINREPDTEGVAKE
ncbi:MAG: YidC/Oxa1 family membrane protein insertase [Bacillota bacterium]